MTNAERQARFRARRAESDIVQVAVFVHRSGVSELQRMAELSRESNGTLVPARMVDVRTGKLRGLK